MTRRMLNDACLSDDEAFLTFFSLGDAVNSALSRTAHRVL
jgi:hypothetical protein